MTKIKYLGDPPASGNGWSYGPNYMKRIGKSSAEKLCFPRHLPNMGYETRIHSYRDDLGDLHFLCVQNISGDLYLACCTADVSLWPDLFGVEVV